MLTGHSAGYDAASQRLANFRRVLEAAAQTDYYRTHLEAARLVETDALNRLRSVEEALRDIPVLEREALIADPSRFRSRLIRPAHKRPDAGLRWLWNRKRESIAGPISALRCLAVEVMTGRAPVPVGARRLMVQTSLIETSLGDRDRDLLWQAFELPVFEELRGLDGELLASECEAHSGLHPEPDSVFLEPAPAPSGLLLTSLAATGYPTLRLRVHLSSVPTPFGCDCGSRVELLEWFQALPARKPVRMDRGTALRSMAGAG
jgi:hypothetical protein